MKTFILALLLTIYTSALAAQGDQLPYCLTPRIYPSTLSTYQGQVDIAKYAGEWFQIVANTNNTMQDRFECAKALYSVLPDGSIGVKNTGTNYFEEFVIEGFATAWDDRNTKLEVSFTKPFKTKVPGNYWILDLDVNYLWVVVGEPCRDYFYILSREVTLDSTFVFEKLMWLSEQGFKLDGARYRKDTQYCKNQ